MKEYYGNYLGICINNQDPEFRGRVQIFIPHIMPALYEGWNQEGEDITIECVGNNLPNGLNSAIIEKLTKILPWSEGAMPIVGASVGGQYNPATGNFNQTSVGEDIASKYSTIDPTSRASFAQELQDPAVQERFFTLMKAEVGGQGSDAQLAFAETVFNRALVQKKSISGIISDTKYYAPYQNGGAAYQKAANSLTNAEKQSYNDLITKVQNGSNITKGATHAGSGVVAANAVNKYDAVSSSLLNIGGETFYSKTFEQDKLSNIFQQGSLNLNQPATAPTPGALPPPPAGWQFSNGGSWFKQQPDESAITQVNAPTPVTTGGPANLAQKAQKAAFSSGTFGAGSTSNCGKIARGVDYNILQDKYFLKGTQGNSRGSANVSTPYWVESDYYKVETTIPDKIPFGSKIVFAVGQGDAKKNRTGAATNGHVTTVGDGGALFGSIAGESFAKYNNIRGDQKVTILTPTQKYRDRYKELYGTDLPEYASSNVTTGAGKVPIDDGGSDISTTIFDNPSPTQILPTDTAGMPAGVFAIPGPGAMLWVFFREGDPLFPVYFAASYGRTEWQNAYQANSQPSDYGKVSVMRTGAADATISNSNLENPYTRQVSFNGSYNEYDLYGQNQFVRGNKHDYTEGMHNWQGSGRQYLCIQDTTDCTLGDRKTIVGNPSQESVDQVNKIKEKIAQVNNKMLEGGNNDPSKTV